jgi:hypothetical protein
MQFQPNSNRDLFNNCSMWAWEFRKSSDHQSTSINQVKTMTRTMRGPWTSSTRFSSTTPQGLKLLHFSNNHMPGPRKFVKTGCEKIVMHSWGNSGRSVHPQRYTTFPFHVPAFRMCLWCGLPAPDTQEMLSTSPELSVSFLIFFLWLF